MLENVGIKAYIDAKKINGADNHVYNVLETIYYPASGWLIRSK